MDTDANWTGICIDLGTTNLRLWLVRGHEILATRMEAVGARDSARTGSNEVIRQALRELIQDLQNESRANGLTLQAVAAAGMITSPLGLRNVDHVSAPAGERELARGVLRCSEPEITDLPFWLIPGIRTGAKHANEENYSAIDLIRGEETLCIGFLQEGLLKSRSTLLNLGSHWKTIAIDENNCVAASHTSLSGELIHAIQCQTILASALPEGRFLEVDAHWLTNGYDEQLRSGFPRALFCVRILEQTMRLHPTQRASFLLGAIISADLHPTSNGRVFEQTTLISGTGAAAHAWKMTLESRNIQARIADNKETERAFVTGLARLVDIASASDYRRS